MREEWSVARSVAPTNELSVTSGGSLSHPRFAYFRTLEAANRNLALGSRHSFANRTLDKGKHSSGASKANLGLGRMDVDVNLFGVESQIDYQPRPPKTPTRFTQHPENRSDQQPVTHSATVDQQRQDRTAAPSPRCEQPLYLHRTTTGGKAHNLLCTPPKVFQSARRICDYRCINQGSLPMTEHETNVGTGKCRAPKALLSVP
jgi:hypothetical protein